MRPSRFEASMRFHCLVHGGLLNADSRPQALTIQSRRVWNGCAVKNLSWLKANHAAMSGCEANVVLVKPEDSALGWSSSPYTQSVLETQRQVAMVSSQYQTRTAKGRCTGYKQTIVCHTEGERLTKQSNRTWHAE